MDLLKFFRMKKKKTEDEAMELFATKLSERMRSVVGEEFIKTLPVYNSFVKIAHTGLKKEIFDKIDSMAPEEGTFCYAHQMQKIVAEAGKKTEYQLMQVIADTYEESIEKVRKNFELSGLNPFEWQSINHCRLDVTPDAPVVPILPAYSAPPTPPEGEIPKEFNLMKLIWDLLYIKDKFAETSHEKGIITKIINNIKAKYVGNETGRNTT
jgi:hypothetical protein